jgi:hypothetical protein
MPATKPKSDKARVRTFSATDRDYTMLVSVAHYHGSSKSAMIAGLIRKEFWRVFPNGTEAITLDEGARQTP